MKKDKTQKGQATAGCLAALLFYPTIFLVLSVIFSYPTNYVLEMGYKTVTGKEKCVYDPKLRTGVGFVGIMSGGTIPILGGLIFKVLENADMIEELDYC